MRKQLDPRIATLIKNNVQTNHRSFIVLVGDKGRDQIVNLHYLLSQARVSARPSVLWCYKKDLGFTSHRKKREAKIKREVKRGIREPNEQDPFEIFVTVTDIRYTYYKETHKILGTTFGMCVLQDFEAITPNLLARTIETVEGGGIIVLLLKTMSSLKQLYTMSMDVHARYRTSSHADVTPRFNERFILSLGSNPACLFLDDELNVLPISRGKDITPLPPSANSSTTVTDPELKKLQESLLDTKPAGDLIGLARTLDQGQCLLQFIDSISEKTLSSTVTLTSGRGRGKSAALGLAIAAALSFGYSNIFVTSPSPENLQTVFEFVFKGLDKLGYEEHLDYDIQQSVNPEFNKAIVRVNVFRDHRQTIQYIQPQDSHVLGQAELVIIDEAAAIPLPIVRNLIGPYLVFLASTINGYEGTGRSLSLKLIQQLRESTTRSTSAPGPSKDGESTAASGSSKKNGAASKSSALDNRATPRTRSLRELKLNTPIRYAPNDPIESWLNSLLCLDASLPPSFAASTPSGCPHPSKCELYMVSRDTLFSYHPVSEKFLQRLMALSFASHYKNTPNDLQLLSDAPAHKLFVLLPPLSAAESNTTALPEPLAVLQIALEGEISKHVIMEGLRRGGSTQTGGDMVPWVVSSQFGEPAFATMSGARVVRVAVNPEYANMGYGSRALQALAAYYSGEYVSLDEGEEMDEDKEYELRRRKGDVSDKISTLHEETLAVKGPKEMPPLLVKLSERKPERLDWLGVSYGITSQLLRFWKRAGYVPLYIRQTANDLTGEHTCVMIRGLNGASKDDLGWLGEFSRDFRRRFLSLLSYQFREFTSAMALSILEAAENGVIYLENGGKAKLMTPAELGIHFTPYDLKRLESYVNNMVDYHAILDLLPTIAKLFFENHLGIIYTDAIGHEETSANSEVQGLTMSNVVQRSILLSLGLQRKSVEDTSEELSPLPVSQVLALFVKSMRKVSKRLTDIQKSSLESSLPPLHSIPAASDGQAISRVAGGAGDSQSWEPLQEKLNDELEHAGNAILREKQREMLESLNLSKYAIDDNNADWSMAEAQVRTGGSGGKSSVVSVKSANATGKKRKAGDIDVAERDGKGGDGDGKKKKTRRGKGGAGGR